MATLKRRLRKKNVNGEYDVIHLETSSTLVKMNDGSTVEDAITTLKNTSGSIDESKFALATHTHDDRYSLTSHTHPQYLTEHQPLTGYVTEDWVKNYVQANKMPSGQSAKYTWNTTGSANTVTAGNSKSCGTYTISNASAIEYDLTNCSISCTYYKTMSGGYTNSSTVNMLYNTATGYIGSSATSIFSANTYFTVSISWNSNTGIISLTAMVDRSASGYSHANFSCSGLILLTAYF